MARHQSIFDAWTHADLMAEGSESRFAPTALEKVEDTVLRLAPEWRQDAARVRDDLEQAAGTADAQIDSATQDFTALYEAAMSTTTSTVTDTVEPATVTNPADDYIISDWPATQTSRIRWKPENVVFHDDGSFDLILKESPEGIYRPYTSGEVATKDTASSGLWEWNVQIPQMVSGSVFGMFLFQADASTRRIEYDLEFVGNDTNSIEINIHMQDDTGRMHRLIGGPITVDLPFDAAQGMHSYQIEVLENEVVFRADGQEIGRFGPEDMPQGVWRTGEMRAYTDLWAVSPGGQEYWAGVWPNPTEPLIAKVGEMDWPGKEDTLPEPEVLPDFWIAGSADADALAGTDRDDGIGGLDGNDTIAGRAGNDTLHGGNGDDQIRLDAGNDVINGGTGADWIVFSGGAKSIDLALTGPQSTGSGLDTITGIEHITAGTGNDTLSGSAVANALSGGDGNDRLFGQGGNDTLTGGRGLDRMDGGAGADTFVFRSASESPLRGGEVITGFGADDVLDLSGLYSGQLAFSDAKRAVYSVWANTSQNGTEVYADTNGDAKADFQVTLWDGFALRASDVIL